MTNLLTIPTTLPTPVSYVPPDALENGCPSCGTRLSPTWNPLSPQPEVLLLCPDPRCNFRVPVTPFSTTQHWVAVAGRFSPFHDGHLNHLEAAKKLGDHLVAIVSPTSGPESPATKFALRLLRSIKAISLVVPALDTDSTVAVTLRLLEPRVFAKGGIWTPGNMPVRELEACVEFGCKVVYGVGR